MASAARILVISDSDQLPTWVRETLAEARWEADCLRVDDEAGARAALGDRGFDVVVCAAGWPRAQRVVDAVADTQAARLPLIVVADSFEQIPDRLYRPGVLLCQRQRGVTHLVPAVAAAVRLGEERSARAGAAAFAAGQQAVLEAIAAGAPLADVLEQIVRLIEGQAEGMLCSILLLDRERGEVRHGAAPHLPAELSRGIDGAKIGPHEGSCGAAAYTRERVIVEDIGTHPNWVPYRHLALPFGLRACWSSPIFSADRAEVLGTFAIYHLEARGPSEREIAWVDRATHLAAIAISRDRAERALRLSEARYRQIVDTAYEGVWLLDSDARTLFVNQRTAEMLGHPAGEMLGRSLFDFMDDDSRARAQSDFLTRLRNAREQQEFRFRRKDGSTFWALLSGSPVREDKRTLVGALAMLTDITDLKSAERALRQSEAEFRVLFESAAIGMVLVDNEGHPVRSNPALQDLLGHDEAELRQRTIADLVHPDDAAENLELAESLMRGRRDSYQNETRFLRKDGTVVWVRVTASLIRQPAEKPRRAIAMIEDVSQRRQMEESVRASERLRALMYNAVNDVVFYVGVEPDGQFRFLSVNPAFLRATGFSEGAVVGRPVTEVIPEPSLRAVLDNYRRAIAERRTITWDEVSSYPAGVRYGEVSIAPIFDDGGTCTNLVGTVHDVTENRLAQERIAAQAALLDRAKDAILVRDLGGAVRYWNEGAARLYGWSAAEAVGRDVTTLIHDEPAALERASRRLLEAGDWSGELTQRTRAGARAVVEASWTLLRDPEGLPRAVLAIHTNVTERKRLEAVMVRSQRLESLGTLAGGIAHDFNNILTAIVANLDSAEQALPARHPARTYLDPVDQALARAAALVAQILTFSRQRESTRIDIELPPLVDEALKLFRAGHPATRVETRFDPDLPPILADATQMHQVVMNLGTNAAQSMNGGGTVRISVERVVLAGNRPPGTGELPTGEYVRLVVADSGCGMDEATIEHIFDPFFTTKPEGKGTGLGLSVVHGIVKNHGGAIAVASTPGKGTQFSVYFPTVR
jgi:two-component system, cell cycle sensor histidine kinase and response regulator CckA